MKKDITIIIVAMLIIAIIASSVVIFLTTEKYQLAVLGLMNGYEIVEFNDDAITFDTGEKSITYYSFGFGIREMKNE